jgi:hypothetical protein
MTGYDLEIAKESRRSSFGTLRGLVPSRGREFAVSASDSAMPAPQDPAKARGFWGHRGERVHGLCSRGLLGGGASLSRTSLWRQSPDVQAKYREFARTGFRGEARFSSPNPFRGPLRGLFP